MFEKYKNKPKQLNYLKKQKALQEKQWNESIKAAQNFNIPIVKINREKVGKSELSKIQEMVEEFKNTKNPSLLNKVITRFENNRVGNYGHHTPLKTKLFSKKIMDNILNDIKETINQEQDLMIKNNLYLSLYKSIVEEQKKVKECKTKRNRNQSPSIDFTKELEEIEQILKDNNIDNSKIRRSK